MAHGGLTEDGACGCRCQCVDKHTLIRIATSSPHLLPIPLLSRPNLGVGDDFCWCDSGFDCLCASYGDICNCAPCKALDTGQPPLLHSADACTHTFQSHSRQLFSSASKWTAGEKSASHLVLPPRNGSKRLRRPRTADAPGPRKADRLDIGDGGPTAVPPSGASQDQTVKPCRRRERTLSATMPLSARPRPRRSTESDEAGALPCSPPPTDDHRPLVSPEHSPPSPKWRRRAALLPAQTPPPSSPPPSIPEPLGIPDLTRTPSLSASYSSGACSMTPAQEVAHLYRSRSQSLSSANGFAVDAGGPLPVCSTAAEGHDTGLPLILTKAKTNRHINADANAGTRKKHGDPPLFPDLGSPPKSVGAASSSKERRPSPASPRFAPRIRPATSTGCPSSSPHSPLLPIHPPRGFDLGVKARAVKSTDMPRDAAPFPSAKKLFSKNRPSLSLGWGGGGGALDVRVDASMTEWVERAAALEATGASSSAKLSHAVPGRRPGTGTGTTPGAKEKEREQDGLAPGKKRTAKDRAKEWWSKMRRGQASKG